MNTYFPLLKTQAASSSSSFDACEIRIMLVIAYDLF